MKKKKTIIISIILVIVLITILYVTLKRNKFVGTWTTDGYTIYEFKKDYTGLLIVSTANYKFNYKIEKNKIYIDFENENSTDSTYDYSFENGKLILNGDNGKYIFTKK